MKATIGSTARRTGFSLIGLAGLTLAGLLAACASAPAATTAPAAPAAAVQTAAAATPAAAAATALPFDQVLPLDARVRTGVLPNGLRYFLRENAKPEGRAFLQIYIDAGSVLETADERGLAHFVEHMAFNGTADFPKSELIDYLRSLGMRFGPEVNAYTSFDETMYGIEVPTADRKVPDKALAILDDWTRAISFLPEDVEAERPVILEEYRTGLGAQDRIQRQILPVLFAGSPYAERLPIGLTDIIKTAPAERLAGFYKKWYRPDNMALVMVGDFDAAALEASLAGRFGAAAAQAPLDRPRFNLPEPVAGAFAYKIAVDPELGYGYVHLYYRRPASPVGSTLGDYAAAVREGLIGGMINQRFQEAATKGGTPFAAAGAGGARYGASSRFYVLSAIPEPGQSEASLAALLAVKESITRFGFTAAEFDRAKAKLLASLKTAAAEDGRTESAALADELGRHYLTGEPVPGIAWELDATTELLAGIDLPAINAAAASLFAADDLTALVLAPSADAAGLPDEARARELIAAAAAGAVAPEAEAVLPTSLLPAPPAPGRVVEAAATAYGAAVWRLSNGAKVIVLPTDNQNDQVAFTAMARGGDLRASDADSISAMLATGIAANSGAGAFSNTDLNRLLAGKQIGLSYWTDYQTRTVQGSAAAADLPSLLELLHVQFAAPRVDPDAAAAYLDMVRTTLQQRAASPEGVFVDAVTTAVTGGHPRYAPLDVDQLGKVSLEAVSSYLGQVFAIGDYTFVFVGNIDPAAFRPLAETYLASLPGARAGAGWTDLGMVRPRGAEVVVRKGTEDKSLVYQAWYAEVPYTEGRADALQVLQEYLDIRLIEEIREKRGGVYSIGANLNLEAAPRDELALTVSFNCDPERAEELAGAVAAELAAVQGGTVDPATLDKARAAAAKSLETSLEDNSFLAGAIAALDVVRGLDATALYSRAEALSGVGAADLAALAGALATPPIRVILYPEQ